MLSKNILITGCNRGIGLELVKQILEKNLCKKLIVTCREPEKAEALQNLSKCNPNLKILKLDASKEDEIVALKTQVHGIVDGEGLNVLFNNAGIAYRREPLADTLQDFQDSFAVNSIAPFLMAKHFLPLIKEAAAKEEGPEFSVKRAAIINMTSSMGSIAENGSGALCSYRCSKAALNCVSKCLSVDLKAEKILVSSVHPGWVKTDMGGPNALITAECCVSKMLETLAEMNENHNGAFIRYNGETVQW